ncbi:tyrosine-protein kinase STYK1-like, partial [Carcharodon carcharias]|uniref:tyrosine-protein kinase STYK1-like n=1 Tax=Carcharodon carcharias TaxID=13397 RepID=UPI001B7F1B86
HSVQGRVDCAPSPSNLTLSLSSPNGFPLISDPELSGWQIPRERLVGGWKQIAQGRYGLLYQAQLASQDTGQRRTVVLKELNEAADPSWAKVFLARVKFHVFLGHHPNLVELVGCCTDHLPFYLVLGNMNRGNLLRFLWTCRKDVMTMEEAPYDLTERQVYNIALQVTSGLMFLHKKGLIHGDIAARNILLQDDFSVRITGLHIPFEIQRSGAVKSNYAVPIKWQSPERIMKKPMSPKSDVWSFGVLLFEMVTLGSPPYPELSSSSVLQYLQRGHRMAQPVTCKAPLYSLMKQCWQWRVSNRPSVALLRKRLQASLKGACDRVVLRVPGEVEPEAYITTAGTWGVERPSNYTIL